MEKKIVLAVLILHLLSFGATLKGLTHRAQYLLRTNQKFLSIDLVDSTSPVYTASIFMTISVPFEPAAKAIMDFDHWPRLFGNITKMKQIRDTTNLRDSSVIYYAEAKYAMVRGWGMGVLDTMTYIPNRSLRVKVRPASAKLVQAYKVQRKGKIKYSVSLLNVEGNLIKINEKQCRIGIFAWAGTNKYMPVWLIDALAKIVMPKFIGDFVHHVQRLK